MNTRLSKKKKINEYTKKKKKYIYIYINAPIILKQYIDINWY